MAPTLACAQAIGAGISIDIEPRLDRDDVAGARIEPAYKARPIVVGPVFAQPSVSVVGGYDGNVFNRPDARAAALAMVSPSLVLRTNLPRHEVRFSAAGTLRRLSRYRTENSEEIVLDVDGRFDLSRGQAIRASAGFSHLIEPRSSAGSVPNATEPVSYDRLVGDVSARAAIGRIGLTPGLRYERVEYDVVALEGGGRADQSFRNTCALRGDVRLDYDLSGLASVFASGSYEDIRSTSATASLRRDSRDYTVVAGLRGRLSPVVSGEIGVGYRARDYRLPIYRDFQGVTFRGDLQWYVTPLMTLRAQASRTFRNSGNRQVGGILTDAFTLSAYYDPLRNLRLSASARLERGDFGETDTRTLRKSMRLQAQYRLNRSLSVGGYVDFVRQDVRGTPLVSQFTSFSAGFGMTFRA
ncbi:outer membrane beta-barrel protein [Novosphingobium mangrovi (ex Huang et al. 2023)]|uniref:Outer membrane beta-barrel protein n=1 Tax=Novosphingobium mangrovi (ex Huang et al. 2023) TaxID=2976432 RepID=A0ABT2I1P7_9SPHN|nr:outer membrane beta-barrel protein [Novosphingobium mangrovi (ex Huang et al. 2023)]MCT2398718.1 outer membrane beta-barrel protein [Novosphingobium mangrovi (ex Huang et al. 2023)]